MTTFEYDGEGRVVKTTAVTESEWDQESYELMAALTELEDDMHACGHPFSESGSKDANPDRKDGHTLYVAESLGLCYACAALDRLQKLPEFSGDNYSPARVFRARKESR